MMHFFISQLFRLTIFMGKKFRLDGFLIVRKKILHAEIPCAEYDIKLCD